MLPPASTYPVSSFTSPPNDSRMFIILARYQYTHFTASQCGMPGLLEYLDTWVITYKMSGQVPSIAYMSAPMASQYRLCIIAVYWDPVEGDCMMESFVLGSIGVEMGFRSLNLN